MKEEREREREKLCFFVIQIQNTDNNDVKLLCSLFTRENLMC